jgi:hypothetical protein
VELIPLNPDQHVVTFVPKLTTELPFFNLSTYQKNLPTVIRFSGLDDAGHPINWEVYQNTNKEIGSPRADAHRVWYLLVKPAVDQARRPDRTIPDIVPLGKIRECLRRVDWTAGGHQERKLIKSLNQIGAAWCVADLWVPTNATDERGKPKYVQVKGRFSRLSVYAIGEHHVTEEELVNMNFDFDLDDILYIKLDPLEARMQESPEQRVYDNQYWFSVNIAARQWYQLVAPKIFGAIKNGSPFCEISYAWYVKRHHTLKRFYERRRVVEQMNRLIKDHLATNYVRAVEYRAVKETDKELDYIIRYYPGEGARESIARIQGHLYHARNNSRLPKRIRVTDKLQDDVAMNVAASVSHRSSQALITSTTVDDELLLFRLLTQFGINLLKGLELIRTNREATINQLRYWPYRKVKISGNLAGWMITAIVRDYAAPSAHTEALQQQTHASVRDARLTQIAACPYCDSMGVIRLQSTNVAGHSAVRLCSHNPSIEDPARRPGPIPENDATSSDAQNSPTRGAIAEDEKRPAEDSASP